MTALFAGLFVWRYWGGQYSVWDKTWTPPDAKGGRVGFWAALTGAGAACAALWHVAARCLADYRGLSEREARRRAGANFWPGLGLGPLLLPDLLGYGHSILSLSAFGAVAGAVLWLSIAPFAAGEAPEPPDSRGPRRALAAGTAGFFALFGGLAVLQFFAMRLGYRDSGIFAESLMNTLRGRFLYTNYYGICNLGDHVELGLLLLLPAFAAFPSVATLLLAQAAALALGAVPLYLIGKHCLGSRRAGALLALAYLLNPGVAHLNFAHVWGFHAVTLCVPFLLAAYCEAWRGRAVRFGVFLALALSMQESVAVAVAMSGPFLFFDLKRRRMGAAATVVGLAWLFLCLKVISPAFWPEGEYRYIQMRWAEMGGTATGVAAYVLRHPIRTLRLVMQTPRLAFLVHLMAPLALLPLRAPWAFLAVVPSVGLLAISNEPRFYSIMGQTTATILPFLFLAAARAAHLESRRQAERPDSHVARWLARIGRFEPGDGPGAARAVAALCFAFSLAFHVLLAPSPLSVAGPDVFEWYSTVPSPRTATLLRLRREIPRDASVAATDKAAAHFVAWRELFVVDREKIGTPAEEELDRAEYVVLDVLMPEDRRHSHAARDRMLAEKSHGVVRREGGFLVFKRGAETWQPPLAENPKVIAGRMAFRPVLGTEGPLRCLGVDVVSLGGGRYRIEALWHLPEATDKDIYPLLLFLRRDRQEAEVGPLWLFGGAWPTYCWPSGAHYLDVAETELPFAPNPHDTVLIVSQGQLTFRD